jgi:hypothetical protein
MIRPISVAGTPLLPTAALPGTRRARIGPQRSVPVTRSSGAIRSLNTTTILSRPRCGTLDSTAVLPRASRGPLYTAAVLTGPSRQSLYSTSILSG